VANNPLSYLDPFGLEQVIIGMRTGVDGTPIPIYVDTDTGRAAIGGQSGEVGKVFGEELAKGYWDFASGAIGGAAALKICGVANSNRYLRIGPGRVPGASGKELRVAFGGKDKFIHGHIDSSNWYRPWAWVQKLGGWKNY